MSNLKPYQPAVAKLLNSRRPASILDAPCGSGWLRGLLDFDCGIDGLDLFAPPPEGYRLFRNANLDLGLPDDLGAYDAIVCCEGIEHFGNPENFFRSAHRHLKRDGMLVVTTPNTWHPAARLQFLLRGFFPGFPCLVGRIERGTHMHIMPWYFPQLFIYLTLAGFRDITLHDIDEPKPKRAYEWLVGLPQAAYCALKRRKAATEEERRFWSQAGSRQSLFGRRLAVSALAA
ncbi:MAG: class I SAM-dependent methyltransferase [Rhodocyclaceae bacterium]|nr:class I SAM-dependent methyltransferase [Rhodocyclaceae bacterium]